MTTPRPNGKRVPRTEAGWFRWYCRCWWRFANDDTGTKSWGNYFAIEINKLLSKSPPSARRKKGTNAR